MVSASCSKCHTAEGLPLDFEVFEGNVAEVKTLLPMLERCLKRFPIERVIVVADRGLLSLDNVAEVERLPLSGGRSLEYILAVPAGRYGDFASLLDDFTFAAASWTLTVHEARPGHEMQFASMIEGGVSVARAIFAANSTNIEGWALYAESFVKPYMPPAGQLISLQHRLVDSLPTWCPIQLARGEKMVRSVPRSFCKRTCAPSRLSQIWSSVISMVPFACSHRGSRARSAFCCSRYSPRASGAVV